jgi:hypothetical protein
MADVFRCSQAWEAVTVCSGGAYWPASKELAHMEEEGEPGHMEAKSRLELSLPSLWPWANVSFYGGGKNSFFPVVSLSTINTEHFCDQMCGSCSLHTAVCRKHQLSNSVRFWLCRPGGGIRSYWSRVQPSRLLCQSQVQAFGTSDWLAINWDP